jgi:hypothetical protein
MSQLPKLPDVPSPPLRSGPLGPIAVARMILLIHHGLWTERYELAHDSIP